MSNLPKGGAGGDANKKLTVRDLLSVTGGKRRKHEIALLKAYPAYFQAVDFAALGPHSALSWTIWGLNSEQRFHRAALSSLLSEITSSGRLLTAAEKEAIFPIYGERLRTTAWAPPTATLAAGLLTWSTSESFRFLIYKPRFKRFDPWFFPAARLPLAKGRLAFFLWHGVRFALFKGVFQVVTTLGIGTYAALWQVGQINAHSALSKFRQDRSDHIRHLIHGGVESEAQPPPVSVPLLQRFKDQVNSESTKNAILKDYMSRSTGRFTMPEVEENDSWNWPRTD